MKNNSIFKYIDYRMWLGDWLKKQGHGAISRLAKELNCQRSYISQVLHSNVHFTLDQSFKLGQIACSSDVERTYLSLLVEFARAADLGYRNHLLQKITQVQQESERLEKIVGREKQLVEDFAKYYYSTWYWSVIHIATSLLTPLSEKQIAEKLNLELMTVSDVLKKLEEFGLVEFKNGFYRFKSGGLHLVQESPWLPFFHGVWRQKSIANFAEAKVKEGVHFTVVQSLSKSDYLEFQDELREVINKFQKRAEPSPSEVVVNFNIDFSKAMKN